jgi:hypothetical protein
MYSWPFYTPGNDMAGKIAKKGPREEQPYTPTTLQTVKQLLKIVSKRGLVEQMGNWKYWQRDIQTYGQTKFQRQLKCPEKIRAPSSESAPNIYNLTVT